MKRLSHLSMITGFSLCFLLSTTAHANTGEVFLDEYSSKEKAAYLNGAIETLAFLQFDSGNETAGKCLINWYGEKSSEKVWRYAEKYPDKSVQALIKILAYKACEDVIN